MSTNIPLFPLNTILVPGLVLPLHIFEPRYRLMVADLLEIPDPDQREFGIVAVRDGHEVTNEGIHALHAVGTSTIIREATLSEDGRYDIVTTGSRRFRIESLDRTSPLLRAEVEWLPEADTPDQRNPTDAINLTELAAHAMQDFRAYRAAISGELDAHISMLEDLPTDPAVLSYLLTAAIMLPTGERAELLEAENARARLELIRTFLKRETDLISHFGALPAIELFSERVSLN